MASTVVDCFFERLEPVAIVELFYWLGRRIVLQGLLDVDR